ncbi:MAG TPA: ATP-binding protein [Kofleriaceae bacterium]|nr:ATP-binding protein [Kofleriaceae bacterium]
MHLARTLELAPDGRRLIVAQPDGLHDVDLVERVSRARAIEPLAAFALVPATRGPALWTVGGTPRALAIDGATTALRLPGDHGRLIRGTAAAQAVWLGTTALLVDATAEPTATPLGDVDFALPVSATRLFVAQRHLLAMREAGALRWQASPVGDGHVVDAAVVFEGRAIALHVVRRHGRSSIVVLGARDGSVQHRIGLAGATVVRFAARRGVALAVLERRRLVLVELRFGRVLADHVLDRDIAELAIDDAGEQIALRHDDALGEVVELDAGELLRARTLAAAAPPTVDAEPPSLAEGSDVHRIPPELELALPPPAPPSLDDAALACLGRREPACALTPGELRQVLAAERALVIATVGFAVARGWDEGRVAFHDRNALPFRGEVESLSGAVRGLAPDELERAARRLDDAHAAWLAQVARLAPRAIPLHALASELELSTLEQQLVLVIAGPALWGELARLYAILVNDPARPLVDEHLLATIFATTAPAHQIAAALDATAPLVRHGIVRVAAGARPFAALAIDPVVLGRLRGAVDHEAVPTRPVCDGEPPRALAIRHDVLARLVDDLAHAPRPLRLAISGRTGSGRHTVLARIAAATGRRLAVLDAAAIARGPARIDELELALQRAHLAGELPCIDGLEAATLQEPVVRDTIEAILARHPGPLAVRLPPRARAPLPPGHLAIELPVQSPTERAATWTAMATAAGLALRDPVELAARYSIGPGTIARVVHEVQRAGGAPDRIERAIGHHLDRELGAIATRVERLATWSQVILPADIQDSITELIGRIRHRGTVFDAWGFDRVMSTSRGITALFQGGPGTGKTLVAGAIANELGLELYRVDVSRIMSKWIGETEQNLARLFDAAEDGNAILLFDEADSLFARRTEVRSSVDRYANVEVNYLLQRLDSFEGIAILTTNFGSSIDSAFKRRLSFRLTFPFPDEDQRERLWRAHLPAEAPVRGQLDLGALARRYQLSGGYIRNCALRAAFLAAEQGSALSGDHLERAIQAEFREIGKLADSGVLE